MDVLVWAEVSMRRGRYISKYSSCYPLSIVLYACMVEYALGTDNPGQ